MLFAMLLLLIVLVVALLAAVLIIIKRAPAQNGQVQAHNDQGAAPGGRSTSAVPDHLDVVVKGFFFSRSEGHFFHMLEQALPPGYRVFPNVRLNDLFLITAPPQQRQATYARLRDKHVDFLIVSLPDHRPVAAIELDGKSHDNSKQQYRDAVKDTAFRSAGLPLLRLRTEETHTPGSLTALLRQHLQPAERRTVA